MIGLSGLRQLHEFYQSHPLPSHRRRGHAMIPSSQGYSPAEVAEILEADADTVRRWIDLFNEQGCAGLVDAYPNQPRQVISELEQQTGKTISRTSLRRYCHRPGPRWKRFRKSLKHRRDEREFRRAKRELIKIASHGDRDFVFFDESALTLRGVVPYGWQPVGERKLVPVSGSSYPSLHTLGSQKPDDTVRCHFHRGTVNSQTVIDVIEHIASHIRRPTIPVLVNSRVHTSAKFKTRLEHWGERELTILRLPTCSPELNAIEGFWNRPKYQRMHGIISRTCSSTPSAASSSRAYHTSCLRCRIVCGIRGEALSSRFVPAKRSGGPSFDWPMPPTAAQGK